MIYNPRQAFYQVSECFVTTTTVNNEETCKTHLLRTKILNAKPQIHVKQTF